MAHRYLTRASALDFYVVSFVLPIAVGLFVLCFFDRQPWQLLLFNALLLATTLGTSGYYHAKARFLLPAFACSCRSQVPSPRPHDRGGISSWGS